MQCKLVFLFSMPVDFQHQGNISFGMVSYILETCRFLKFIMKGNLMVSLIQKPETNLMFLISWLFPNELTIFSSASWYSKCGEAKKCEFIHAIKVKLSIHTYVSPPSRMSDMDTPDAGVRHRAPHRSRSPTHSRFPSNSRSPRRQHSSTPRISQSVTESPMPRRPWRRWRNRRRRRGQGQVYTCFPGH